MKDVVGALAQACGARRGSTPHFNGVGVSAGSFEVVGEVEHGL
jgi:hypothetical protein